MASSSSGSSHLGVTDNQKRWLVAGIALNKILLPQIRPFVEQDINKEYNNLKTSHNIHTQSTSGRLQRWPARKFLKYENINGNDAHPKLPGGRYDYARFDCRVLSHVDFARLYVENYMAKFNAFDDHCDASAVLLLLGGVPVFSAAVQAAAGDVRMARNDWAHCVFSKWDPTKFQQSFMEMEDLVRAMALPAADEGKLLGELKDWEMKGMQLCMNSPVDPALLQLVQQQVKYLQDDVNNLSEFEEERSNICFKLQDMAITLAERVQRLEDRVDDFHGDLNQLIGQVKDEVHNLHEKVDDLTVKAKETIQGSSYLDSPTPAVNPQKLVELIRRDYKGAVLCPFPWCEDELQMKLSSIFTRLQIVSRRKERSNLTDNTVNMTDVFIPHAECVSPRVVLIEGNPGMGKTTYCQKLAYDWSMGEIPPEASFPKVDMLLLLKCRDMNMKTANIEEAIDDQLLPQDADKKEKGNFFHFVRSNQSRILLVLDGLDELREDLVQGFLPLIQGKVFANVYLILTARHEAGMRVRRYCDTLLEIVGYTHNDVECYIKKYFSSHEEQSLADNLVKQLSQDQQLRELTVNPLNTALLCLLCEETRGVFPSKRTKLYDELVSCALRRYFAKRGVSLDGDDPLERCADQLNLLGRVAFEALLQDQMYFSQDKMKCQPEDFLQLCFLSREPSVSKIRPTPCYAFTHKTFQEYFAAFYLAHKVFAGDKGNEKLLNQLSPFDNWQVWEFLLTMMTSKSTEMAVIVVSRLCASLFHHKRPQRLVDADVDLDVKICEKKPHDWTKYIRRLSKNEQALVVVVNKTLRLIAECEDGENELRDYQTKMVHVLAKCFPVKKIELKTDTRYCSVYSEYLKFNCTLTDLLLIGALDPLLLATVHSNHNLVHFSLRNAFIGLMYAPPERDKAFSNLKQRVLWMQLFGSKALFAELLQSGRHLTHLNLDNVWISDGGTQALAEVLHTNRTLTHLNLSKAMIFDLGAIALGNVLQSNCTLTHLSLPENWISGTGTASLARGFQSNSVVVYLDLSQNLGGDSVAVALAQALESNCALKYLDLSQWYNCREKKNPFAEFDNVHVEMIGPLGGSALARALRLNCTLTFLDLRFNNIGDSGAVALAEALQTNCTLTELYLEDNKIGESGAEALGKALQSNRTLTHLDLNFNLDIGDTGAAAVAKALQSNGSLLTRLDLSLNKISSSGGTAIAEALQSNSSLTHLGLWRNMIQSSGAVAIAKALKSNRTLTHLDLRSNGIGDSGATELAEALQFHNNTLIYLDLRDESIGSIGTESLKRIDQSNCIVKYYRHASRK